MHKRNSSGSYRGRKNSRKSGTEKPASAAKSSSGTSGTRKRFRKTDQAQSTERFAKPTTGKKPFQHNESKDLSKRTTLAKKGESGLGYKKTYLKKKPSFGKPSGEKSKPTINSLAGTIRLNRYISNSGICSRREADELIRLGLVSVNGKVVTEMGFQVKPRDEVRYENRVLRAEKPVYILMNKPKGFLTTTKDPQERNTVMHIIGGSVKERVYPVGRLDRNTTGLLLLTNDGDLAEKLSHPSYNVKKIYRVELNRALTKADFQRILDGVQLEEGRAQVDDLAIVSDDGKTVGIELHIGWNRVVRRIFEKLEYEVLRLDRSVYAGLDKKDLPRGHWRFLTPEEIVRLKHFGK